MSDRDKPTQLIDEIDYEIGQDNVQAKIGPFGLDIHNPVFLIAGLGVVAFVLGTLMLPEEATALFAASRDYVTGNFSWFFILAGNIFVLFGLALIVSPLGSIRLGGADATPDY
ncbi:MAG: BCCT family transporter, partial [Pseudomonadota bacterium]